MCHLGLGGKGWKGLAEVVAPEPRPKEAGVEKKQQRWRRDVLESSTSEELNIC